MLSRFRHISGTRQNLSEREVRFIGIRVQLNGPPVFVRGTLDLPLCDEHGGEIAVNLRQIRIQTDCLPQLDQRLVSRPGHCQHQPIAIARVRVIRFTGNRLFEVIPSLRVVPAPGQQVGQILMCGRELGLYRDRRPEESLGSRPVLFLSQRQPEQVLSVRGVRIHA